MASHLGQTVYRVMKETTVSQFEKWKAILTDPEKYPAFHFQSYYLANIAYLQDGLRCSWSDAKPAPFKDFLLTFKSKSKSKTKQKPYKDMTEEEKKDRISISKAYWKSRGAAGPLPGKQQPKKSPAVPTVKPGTVIKKKKARTKGTRGG